MFLSKFDLIKTCRDSLDLVVDQQTKMLCIRFEVEQFQKSKFWSMQYIVGWTNRLDCT